jgi:hypothetical protein
VIPIGSGASKCLDLLQLSKSPPSSTLYAVLPTKSSGNCMQSPIISPSRFSVVDQAPDGLGKPRTSGSLFTTPIERLHSSVMQSSISILLSCEDILASSVFSGFLISALHSAPWTTSRTTRRPSIWTSIKKYWRAYTSTDQPSLITAVSSGLRLRQGSALSRSLEGCSEVAWGVREAFSRKDFGEDGILEKKNVDETVSRPVVGMTLLWVCCWVASLLRTSILYRIRFRVGRFP